MAKKKIVSFSFRAPQRFNDVKLAGSFTNWEQGAIEMTKGRFGQWKAEVNLEPGEYEYKFMADGKWLNDPKADKIVPNSRGSENSIRVVK